MMHLPFFALYFAVLLVLCGYGLHRSHLVFLYWRHRRQIPLLREGGKEPVSDAEAPRVTIQLPLYNEATVAVRLLRAVAQMDYPRNRFEIQVLDDSTDETRHLVEREVDRLRDAGLDAVVVRRSNRIGYKAGALAAGLDVAKGELVAIFDADFLPQPDFLRNLVGEFRDPTVGMVQARWGHMNREHSLMTRVQALMLDGHHLVENRARFSSGRLFNFSGTGGLWRVQAIRDAGGWQHDTLTEDLDLSYRAQLQGWRFVYREDVVTPSELPEDVSSLRAQQYRWAKGTVQTARKLLGVVMRSNLTLSQRVEAVFHLTPHFAYPLMMVLSVLLLPALLLSPSTDLWTMAIVDLPLCLGTTMSLGLFYGMAERSQGGSAWTALRRLPALIALGMGMAPHLTRAVSDGMQSMAGEFIRTPKKGTLAGRYSSYSSLPLSEMALCLVSLASVFVAIETDHWIAMPFASLFAFGYGYVATLVVREQSARRRAAERLEMERATVAS
ncbi:MAG: glycosyltransferase [Deltaproteobacteria bacterium HGW-Deltaproteobacteria-20]|nr:MAG: glycosyltransferase [Deltaproteobacteria bacterium HGW-Deltaproteobacteria-20]